METGRCVVMMRDFLSDDPFFLVLTQQLEAFFFFMVRQGNSDTICAV